MWREAAGAADFEAEEVCVVASFEGMMRNEEGAVVVWTYLLVFSSVLNPTLVPTALSIFRYFALPLSLLQHAAAVVQYQYQYKSFFRKSFSLSKPAARHHAFFTSTKHNQLLQQALQLVHHKCQHR